MTKVIVLDTGPLGLITNPNQSKENTECNEWFLQMIRSGNQVVLPEIADYEIRRELLRAKKIVGLKRLDALSQTTSIRYDPITTEIMRKAAELWAQARQQGTPTADPKALDGDVILAAQAITLAIRGNPVVVATTNVGHLSLFVDARLWRDIF